MKSRSQKIISAVFTAAFLLVIVGIAAHFVFAEPRETSVQENRKLAQIKPPESAEVVLSGAYMTELEEALSDQIALRDSLAQAKATISRNVCRVAYAFLPDVAIPIFDASDKLLWASESVLLPKPANSAKSTYKRVNRRIGEYAYLCAALPEKVNVLMYEAEERAISPLHPTAYLCTDFAGAGYRDYFLAHKTDELIYGMLALENKQQFLSYYYKTDHHWSSKGVWQAYQDIYAMLAPVNKKLTPALTLDCIEVVGSITESRGSYAVETAYSTISEPFTRIVTNEKYSLTSYINGKKATRGNWQLSEDKLEYPEGGFVSWYQWYYGLNYGQIEYRNNDKSSQRQLLIIGSSMTNPIEMLLASHYKNTFVVDQRYFERDMGKPFDILSFVNEHGIDDIIFIGKYFEMYTDTSLSLWQYGVPFRARIVPPVPRIVPVKVS